jgi:hypothetical protein
MVPQEARRLVMSENQALAQQPSPTAPVRLRLFNIPSWSTILSAAVVIVIFLCIAHYLYFYPSGDGVSKVYRLKVADAFISGAIVGLFVALVKAFFDFHNWVHER